MTWFKTNDASVSNGGTVVTIGDGANTSVVKAGDALIIGSFQPVEVKTVFSGQIELVEAWNNSTQSGQAATAMPTSGDFKSATEALRNATKITQDNYKVIQDWGKETGTVTFVDYEGTEHEAKTMKEMENVFDASLAQREAAYDALIASSHLNWRTEADMYAMLAQNNDRFDASGFVRFGKHSAPESPNEHPINEGLYTMLSTPNSLGMGRVYDDAGGNSVTALPHLNIAGFVTELDSVNDGGIVRRTRILLPDAPDGTVTYDSATGDVFDYKAMVDPKYGDVAADLGEAVARAFEGVIENGDFRLGDTGWDKLNGATIVDGKGILSGSGPMIGQYSFDPDTAYYGELVVEADVDSGVGDLRIIENSGVNLFSCPAMTAGEVYTIKFEFTRSSASNRRCLIQNVASGKSFTVHSVTFQKAGVKVVTERVDMYGFEGWLEEITSANPFVYKHGLPQSQASDIDGVATTDSNRPDSYYAVFTGDTTSRGKGVDFLSLSVLQQDVIALNPKNHIYMIDGKPHQWRVRQRTLAGLGNGDWVSINANVTGSQTLKWADVNSDNRVAPQGKNDEPFLNGGGNGYYASTHSTYNDDTIKHKGVWTSRSNGAADEGKCYFLVCGTVTRLNQGAYHPAHNPSGCNSTRLTSNGGTNKWHNANAYQFRGTQDTFNPRYISENVNVDDPTLPYDRKRGNIEGGYSGRDDQYEFYDAVYAGQVNDVRMSALGVRDTSAALGAAIRKAVHGEMRGRDRVPFTGILTGYCQSSSSRLYLGGTENEWLGDNDVYLNREYQYDYASQTLVDDYKVAFQILDAGDTDILARNGWSLNEWLVPALIRTRPDANVAEISNVGGSSFDLISTGSMRNVKIQIMVPLEVSQKFDSLPWVDIIGDPERIAATFPNGVIGQWVGVPDGSTTHPLNRKAASATEAYTFTTDDGVSWAAGTSTSTINAVTNERNAAASGAVLLSSYEALSDFTEAADSSKIVGEVGGVVSFVTFRPEFGNRLTPSLIGEVGVHNSQYGGTYSVTQTPMMDPDSGEMRPFTNEGAVVHNSVDLPAPANGSHAVKALYTLTEKNGQLFLQLHGRELVWTSEDTNNATVIADPDVGEDVVKGEIVLYNNELLQMSLSGNIIFGTLVRDDQGYYRYKNSGTLVATPMHRTGSWGDDDIIPVVDGDSTMTDLDGNTVKTFCHHTMYPIGWVKSEI